MRQVRKFRQLALIVFIVVIIGTLMSALFVVRRTQFSNVEMIIKSMKSVVAVYYFNIGIPASGFYIGNGIIVTAGHVAKESGLEKIVFEDGDTYDIIQQIVHPDFDCGFLIISEENNEPVLKFDIVEVQRGEEIYVLGNPGGLTFNVSKGIISSINRICAGYFGETILIGYDAATACGGSGSLVADRDGEIRGVHVGNNGFHGSAVAITASEILKAMNAAGLEVD